LKKIRFYRLFAVLILAILIVGVVLFILSWLKQDEDKASISTPHQEQIQEPAHGPALGLPQLPLNPQTMTDAQKRQAIATAGEDAMQSALASGQSEERARQAAERARQQARLIFGVLP